MTDRKTGICVYLFDELLGEDESLAFLFFCGALSDPEEHLCVRVQQEHILWQCGAVQDRAGAVEGSEG